jgi:hypothetical protein
MAKRWLYFFAARGLFGAVFSAEGFGPLAVGGESGERCLESLRDWFVVWVEVSIVVVISTGRAPQWAEQTGGSSDSNRGRLEKRDEARAGRKKWEWLENNDLKLTNGLQRCRQAEYAGFW